MSERLCHYKLVLEDALLVLLIAKPQCHLDFTCKQRICMKTWLIDVIWNDIQKQLLDIQGNLFPSSQVCRNQCLSVLHIWTKFCLWHPSLVIFSCHANIFRTSYTVQNLDLHPTIGGLFLQCKLGKVFPFRFSFHFPFSHSPNQSHQQSPSKFESPLTISSTIFSFLPLSYPLAIPSTSNF